MKNLKFHYHMEIVFSEPIRNHTYTLKCVPQTTRMQEITQCSINISPENKVQRGRDSFGNSMLYGNVEEMHGAFSVDVTGKAKTGILRKELSDEDMDISIYKYQTPLTRPGERILELLKCGKPLEKLKYGESLEKLLEARTLAERVRFYMNRVYESMRYVKGATNIDTSAEAALTLGEGVCQDYAHILLSMCREEKIPARYVVGMFLGEGESHAWVEVFDGKNWVGFDPTNNLLTDDSYIKISHGRDYRDCSINRGVFTGQAQQRQRILVEVTEEG